MESKQNYNRLVGKIAPYQKILEQLRNHQIPDAYPEADRYPLLYGPYSLDEGSFFIREDVIRYAGYSFVAYRWLRPLATWIGNRKCLEIMGGSGALSRGLQDCGVNIHCTDTFSWVENKYCWYENAWTTVECIDAVEAIYRYGKDIDLLVCSWPYTNDDCFYALQAMREVNPSSMMIYIGEGKGGCTASDKFFDSMIPVEDKSFEKAVEGYRAAYRIRDRIHLCR